VTWQVVIFAAVCALFALVALSMICTAVQNIHIARATGADPRNDPELRRSAQEELLRKRKQAP
jgi:hypothetical protein